MQFGPDQLDPITMRLIAEKLLDLAGGHQSSNKERFGKQRKSYWPIEAQDTNLAELAKSIYMIRAERRKFFSANLFGEPSWDMLLDLYIQKLNGVKVPITSAAIASHTALTTALRYMTLLVELGFAERTPSRNDRRVSFFVLTEKGEAEVTRYLLALSRSPYFAKAIGLGNRFSSLDCLSQN